MDDDSPFIPQGVFAITKSDTTNDPGGTRKGGKPGTGFRGVWIDAIGGGAAIKITFMDGSTGVFTVPAGIWFPGHIAFVWSTGTTATVTYGAK